MSKGKAEKIKIASSKLEVALEAGAPQYYWGNWLVENTIVTLTGTGGVSKSTFVYDLMLSLIEHQEYFNIKGFAPKVLYFDAESNDALIHSRIRLLGKEKIASTSYFEYINDPQIKLVDFENQRDEWVADHFEPDIIVLDPVTLVFPGEENDNQSVTKQMNHLRKLIAKWHCIFLLVFHPSKASDASDNVTYARGAGAWANLADVCMNLYRIKPKYGDDLAILEIPKNRWCNDGFKQCLKIEDGEFNPVEFPKLYLEEQHADGIGGLETFNLMKKIRDALESGQPFGRKELWVKMDINTEKGVMFYRAITALQQRGEVKKVTRGVYQKVVETGKEEQNGI